MHRLILGGQKSGKSAAAIRAAQHWLAQPNHSGAFLATATASDPEMRGRIARHQHDRMQHAPGLMLFETPFDLPQAIVHHSQPSRMLVVDCLTLWLANLTVPGLAQAEPVTEAQWQYSQAALCDALAQARGPVVLVSNEIGFGVIPMGEATRQYVDRLGLLHQRLAALCSQVTLTVAGIEVAVKGVCPPVE